MNVEVIEEFERSLSLVYNQIDLILEGIKKGFIASIDGYEKKLFQGKTPKLSKKGTIDERVLGIKKELQKRVNEDKLEEYIPTLKQFVKDTQKGKVWYESQMEILNKFIADLISKRLKEIEKWQEVLDSNCDYISLIYSEAFGRELNEASSRVQGIKKFFEYTAKEGGLIELLQINRLKTATSYTDKLFLRHIKGRQIADLGGINVELKDVLTPDVDFHKYSKSSINETLSAIESLMDNRNTTTRMPLKSEARLISYIKNYISELADDGKIDLSRTEIAQIKDIPKLKSIYLSYLDSQDQKTAFTNLRGVYCALYEDYASMSGQNLDVIYKMVDKFQKLLDNSIININPLNFEFYYDYNKFRRASSDKFFQLNLDENQAKDSDKYDVEMVSQSYSKRQSTRKGGIEELVIDAKLMKVSKQKNLYDGKKDKKDYSYMERGASIKLARSLCGILSEDEAISYSIIDPTNHKEYTFANSEEAKDFAEKISIKMPKDAGKQVIVRTNKESIKVGMYREKTETSSSNHCIILHNNIIAHYSSENLSMGHLKSISKELAALTFSKNRPISNKSYEQKPKYEISFMEKHDVSIEKFKLSYKECPEWFVEDTTSNLTYEEYPNMIAKHLDKIDLPYKDYIMEPKGEFRQIKFRLKNNIEVQFETPLMDYDYRKGGAEHAEYKLNERTEIYTYFEEEFGANAEKAKSFYLEVRNKVREQYHNYISDLSKLILQRGYSPLGVNLLARNFARYQYLYNRKIESYLQINPSQEKAFGNILLEQQFARMAQSDFEKTVKEIKNLPVEYFAANPFDETRCVESILLLENMQSSGLPLPNISTFKLITIIKYIDAIFSDRISNSGHKHVLKAQRVVASGLLSYINQNITFDNKEQESIYDSMVDKLPLKLNYYSSKIVLDKQLDINSIEKFVKHEKAVDHILNEVFSKDRSEELFFDDDLANKIRDTISSI